MDRTPIYKKVLKEMNENREKRLRGDITSIPWSLPRISKVLPGIEQKRYNLVSAPPKGGKTQFTDFLFMYEPINWLYTHPESSIKLKIFYFSLEISKEAKLRSAISHRLFSKYKITASPQKLMSVFEDYIYDDKIKSIVESPEFEDWLNFFENIVDFNDSVRNPYGIYNTVRSFAEANGHYSYKEIDWLNSDGKFEKKTIKDIYYPNDPDLYVIIIIDHISLLQPERGQNLHQAISKMSSDYCLHMRDKWGYIPTVVQQQSAASSTINQSSNKKYAMELVKPDSEGLADNKYTARDVDLMISLFNPSRYDIPEYKGWDLYEVGDHHREFNINLNRNGISNASCQLYFNGASSFFAELPSTPSTKVYEDIKQWEKMKI